MCLGQEDKEDLLKPLRNTNNNDILKEVIYKAILRKPKGHDFVTVREKKEKLVPRYMNVTGG
jgi:cyclic pyranopterin phosphate synthase